MTQATEQQIKQETAEQLDPIAIVDGENVMELPEDLYIPPDALEVFLEAFEGPLDLLLYLIKRQNLDILNIPISDITKQYVEYVEMMKLFRLELAAEYLVMAATLAEIKSRMLLPRSSEQAEDDEEDPRAELIRRLQEYERFKIAGEDFHNMPQAGRDIFAASSKPPEMNFEKPLPDVELKDLLLALKDILARAELSAHHKIVKESLSIRERMSQVLSKINAETHTDFVSLFTIEEGRMGVVVTFIAVLELIKQSMVEIIQTGPYQPIHVKARVAEESTC